MSDLCKALRDKNQGKFFQWLECDEWKTIETMIEHHGISFINYKKKVITSSKTDIDS